MKIFVCLLGVLTLGSALAKEILCEKKELWGRGTIKGLEIIDCEIRIAAIDSPDATIEVDSTVTTLEMSNNLEVKFLPVELATSFPQLIFYFARNCSITTIAKIHFKDLTKLEKLFLDKNQIVKIPSDTFEDLKSLWMLKLGKQMNVFS